MDSRADSKIAILIYAYNVEETIAEIVTTCLKASDKVLVIDDGSRDNTLDLIRDLPITVIRNDFQTGKDQCMIRGFSYLQPQQPKAIITIDASEFYYFDEVEKFLEAGVKYPKHVIIGVQTKHSRLADFLMSWLVGEPVGDFQSSIRLLPNNIVTETIKTAQRKSNGMLDAKLVIDAKKMGFSFLSAEIPERFDKKHIEKPHKNNLRFWLTIIGLLLSKALNPIGLIKALFRRKQKIKLD
jgi:glycosyltransferase involved in cell wall biosynthesis